MISKRTSNKLNKEREKKMDIAIKNTFNEIVMQIQVQRRSTKAIADDCGYFAKQCKDESAKEIFTEISNQKRKASMLKILNNHGLV